MEYGEKYFYGSGGYLTYVDEHSREDMLHHQQKEIRNQISERGEESFHMST